MLQLLVFEGCAQLGIDPYESVMWERISLDFEAGFFAAFRMLFVELRLIRLPVFSGCYYHFCAAVWRNVQLIGLAPYYFMRATGLRAFVDVLLAIAFLPIDAVTVTFQFLVANHSPVGAAENQLFRDFIDYFRETWITPDGSYTIADWNLYERNDHFTNNVVEGLNNSIGLTFGNHSNLWDFLLKCRRFNNAKEIEEDSHILGYAPSHRRRSYRLKIVSILNCKVAFAESPREFADVWKLLLDISTVNRHNFE